MAVASAGPYATFMGYWEHFIGAPLPSEVFTGASLPRAPPYWKNVTYRVGSDVVPFGFDVCKFTDYDTQQIG